MATKEKHIVQLTKKERDFLSTLVSIFQKISNPSTANNNGSAKGKTRRSFEEVEAMKRTVFAARKKNVSVRSVAEKLGVTPSYVYQLERK